MNQVVFMMDLMMFKQVQISLWLTCMELNYFSQGKWPGGSYKCDKLHLCGILG